jgi:hypothetical protein
LPDPSSRAWIEALRADIQHIHEIRWKLSHLVATHSSDEHLAGRERGPAIARIRTDVYRHQLDEFEQDTYHSLDPYLAKLEQGLVERSLGEDRKTTNTDRPVAVMATELNDLKRLRQAKLQAIDLARQVLRHETASNRTGSRVWILLKDVAMRGVFFAGFWVFRAGLWVWVHVLRRDTSRH